MPKQSPIEYKNMNHEPGKGFYVGYLKGKRKKFVEQAERYETPEVAMEALGIRSSDVSKRNDIPLHGRNQ
jgi:hypothetical protein